MIIKRQIVLLLVWNFVWSGFAIDQIKQTYDYLQPKSHYGNKVMIERDGTKFLVNKNLVENEEKVPIDHCPNENILGAYFNHKFDFESSENESIICKLKKCFKKNMNIMSRNKSHSVIRKHI